VRSNSYSAPLIKLLDAKMVKSDIEFILNVLRSATIVIGVTVAVVAYIANTRNRALENSVRLVDMFFERVSKKQIEWWKRAFRGTADQAGVPNDQIRLPLSLSGILKEEDLTTDDAEPQYDDVYPISFLFTEGPPDQGSVQHICNVLEIICYETNRHSTEVRYVYYRLGQIIDHCASLVAAADLDTPMGFPNLAKLSRAWRRKSRDWPQEIHIYCE